MHMYAYYAYVSHLPSWIPEHASGSPRFPWLCWNWRAVSVPVARHGPSSCGGIWHLLQNRWKFGHKLPAGRYHPLAITYHNSIQFLFIRIYTILSCSLFPIYFSYLLKQSSMLADSFTVNMSKPVWGHEAQLVFWPWLSAKHISFVFAVFHLRLLQSEAWKRSSQTCTCRRFAELDEVGTQNRWF